MKYIKFDNMIFKVTEFDGYYVCKEGYIISIKVKGGQGEVDYDNPRYHSVKKDKDGYFEVCLSIIEDGIHKRKYRRLHRLVWETFNYKLAKRLTIDHIDCNKENNNINNLQVMTRGENTAKANKLRCGERRNIAKGQTLYRLTINGEIIENLRYSELVKDYKISEWYISQINKGNYPKKLKEKGILLERV